MRLIRYNCKANCVVCNEVLEGGFAMIILRPKWIGVLFGVTVGVLLSIVVVAPGMFADNSKVIKKVTTTHKVVNL